MCCPICYEEGAKCQLVCGHSFHHSCIKEWYMNAGNNSGCPMCRNKIYFKGLHKKKKLWEEEKRDKKCSEIYTTVIQDLLEMAKTCSFIRLHFKEYLEYIEDDYTKLKDIVVDYDDLEYLIGNPDVLITDEPNVPLYYTRTTHRQATKHTKAAHRQTYKRNKKNNHYR